MMLGTVVFYCNMLAGRSDFIRNVLLILQIPGLMGLLTCVVALIYGEYLALYPFFCTALLTLIPAWLLNRRLKEEGDNKINNPLSFIALSYGIVSLLGALPLYTTAILFAEYTVASEQLMNLHHPLNALFESFAGFTSSGLTLIDKPADLLHALLFWRSLSQWVGGLGIFTLVVFIFSPGEEGTTELIKTEVGNIFTKEKNSNLIGQIWIIYLGLTLLGFLLFLLAEQSVWISLNHALTAVSTGGFNVTNESFKYQPLDSKIYSMVLMVLGAMGFLFHREFFWNRNPKALFKYRENLVFLILMVLGLGWMVADSRISEDSPTLVDNIYQWVSAFTTSGYQTADIGKWEDWRIYVLAVVMFIGGVGGSTAGGIKIRRLMLLFYIMAYSFTSRKGDRYSQGIEFYGEGENMEEILSNFITLLGVWLLVMGLSVLLVAWILPAEWGLAQVLFEVVSAQSNVGLTTGITQANMHWLVKMDFIVLMWMGRLELVAVIIMFRNWI